MWLSSMMVVCLGLQVFLEEGAEAEATLNIQDLLGCPQEGNP